MSGDVHTLSGAYALGAVDDVERAAFERHLAECEPCRVEVAELRETATRLADDTDLPVPSPGLRERTLAQVARTPQLRNPPTTGSVKPERRRWRGWAAAAAAVVVAASGASAVTWSVSSDRLGQEQAAGEQARQVSEVLAAADARVYNQPLRAGGAATVVVSRERDQGVVLLRDLPQPEAGRTYQLWLLRDAVPRSVGLLNTGATGTTMVIGPVSAAATFGVSSEPSGGSPAPTRIVGTVELG
ncbi:anti-sigma factor [Micromonospora endolithica]|uniref:Regulator of SigK n=1 Tax=Micromonospora endolithica TaxID=230091 RepID=A0A3A9YRQ5_9ACTN|nr:anti-sigma factor [Micromonospora endolithica]RKN38698.1 anti-sigma factor [Micromonospora endolithica]TWJ25235.1 anti-sigma-K factor RskA [Micromonospora endolithica]